MRGRHAHPDTHTTKHTECTGRQHQAGADWAHQSERAGRHPYRQPYNHACRHNTVSQAYTQPGTTGIRATILAYSFMHTYRQAGAYIHRGIMHPTYIGCLAYWLYVWQTLEYTRTGTPNSHTYKHVHTYRQANRVKLGHQET